MNKKHFTLEERITLSSMLSRQASLKQIAQELGKSPSTVSREVRNHLQFKKSGAYGHAYNSCLHRKDCSLRSLCAHCSSPRQKYCRFCEKCNGNCADFVKEECLRLTKPPYVCNGCPDRNRCTLEKRLYNAKYADEEYRLCLVESRSGISYSEEEIRHLDEIVSPLIRKGQSLNHICAANRDSLMVSESTLYRLIDHNVFTARNLDLPRKVRYSRRKIKKAFKVDRSCRIGRSYKDYLAFRDSHPDLPVVQMDSVEGKKGGKVLLTIHFVSSELMLAFLRDSNDARSVTEIFERLYLELRSDLFLSLFPLLLADNGSEFSDPKAIEFDTQGNRRTQMFYCDPASPGQKGSAEKNHELIRYVIPKGTSLDALTQDDISLLMDHINSYRRESLGNKCPYEVFEFFYGRKILDLLGCHRIPSNDVHLTPALLKHCR